MSSSDDKEIKKKDLSSWGDLGDKILNQPNKPIWHVPEVVMTEEELKAEWKPDEPFSTLNQVSESNDGYFRGCLLIVVGFGLFVFIIVLARSCV